MTAVQRHPVGVSVVGIAALMAVLIVLALTVPLSGNAEHFSGHAAMGVPLLLMLVLVTRTWPPPGSELAARLARGTLLCGLAVSGWAAGRGGRRLRIQRGWVRTCQRTRGVARHRGAALAGRVRVVAGGRGDDCWSADGRTSRRCAFQDGCWRGGAGCDVGCAVHRWRLRLRVLISPRPPGTDQVMECPCDRLTAVARSAAWADVS